MLAGLEFEKCAANLLAHVLVKSESTVLAAQLVEYFLVLFKLDLGREDLQAHDLVIDSCLKLLPLLLTVDDLGQLIRLFRK